jgi:hypothetical protein
MVIFNLWAVPAVIVILVIMHFAARFFPQLADQSIISWPTGIIAIVVGGIFDLVGLKARLFFLPIWLIGVVIVCIQIGWPGTVLLIVIAIAGVAWIFRSGRKKEREDWEKAQQELMRSTSPPAGATERELWEWVKARLFLPLSMRFTPQICDHNLCVVRVIKTSGPALTEEETAKISTLEDFLMRSKGESKPLQIEPELQKAVTDVVDKRLRKATADEHKPAVPPKIR